PRSSRRAHGSSGRRCGRRCRPFAGHSASCRGLRRPCSPPPPARRGRPPPRRRRAQVRSSARLRRSPAPSTASHAHLSLLGWYKAMPVVLPKPSDPRLHLAAVITSLQVLGQTEFHFRVSIAQILLALVTCAVLEIAITARKQHVWMWPASALLT